LSAWAGVHTPPLARPRLTPCVKLPSMAESKTSGAERKIEFYCPKCAREVAEPLTCGDCGAVICPRCGTPVEDAEELGMG
jgi:endogenous inhibitor of DNA gyrase (YacG/DUF329 family)